MKLFFGIIFSFALSVRGVAQIATFLSNTNTIETAVPFLLITPDARAAGMGETGVSTSPDVNAMHWNPAKFAFSKSKMGFGISYTPWLRALVPDVNLAYLSFYAKPDSNSAVAASVRYFSLGNVTSTVGQYRPNEFAFDIGYSRRVTAYWSLGVAGRYIQSNLTGIVGGQTARMASSAAVDVGAYYLNKDRVKIFGKSSTMMMGVAITNMGSKMSYYNAANRNEFLPINLRLGQGFKIDLDARNQFSFQYEFNKLLVPSPPIYKMDSAGNPSVSSNGDYVILAGKNPNVSVPRGMIQSFYDAPGGGKEELWEVTAGVGGEYWYNNTFAVRAGYFYQNKHKGNEQYITLGAGVKYNVFGLDFAYLIPTNGQRSPLQNTLRFSLLFDFGKPKA